MCGIAGFLGAGTDEDLRKMMAALAHRGPDGEGAWCDPERMVYLGHRRLSVVDLACGAQPMVSSDGDRIIVFNGEIYNHRELRAELTALGRTFRTDHSDTEVLLEAYAVWGERMTQRLNGMWAFALHDRRARTLFCSRDRFGKKPLYYRHAPGFFCFSSELRSLRAHPLVAALPVSEISLQKYFAYGYIPAPRTIIEGVRKLAAGHSLLVTLDRPDQATPVRYWRYIAEPQHRSRTSVALLGEELRELLGRAVRRRLDADVPAGIFLSGGVDSSIIAALACQAIAPRSVRTYTVGFTEPSFDESAYAAQVATHLGTSHRMERLSLEIAGQHLPQLAARFDEPMADSSLLPCHLLSQFARREVTVALGGDGGDELFAGYDPFQALRRAEWYQRLVPRPIHRGIAALAARLPVSHRNMSLDFKLKRTLRGLSQPPKLWLPTWMAPLGQAELSELFARPMPLDELYSEAIESWETCASADLVDRTSQFYIELYLQNDILPKVDQASMMHGLEVRCPFLDIEVADFARSLPHEFKLHGGVTKFLLKEAFDGLLPRSILHRSKKGFGVPIGAWFRNSTLTVDGDRSPNPAFTRSALTAHRNGSLDHRAYLWCEWVWEQWSRAS